MPIDPKEELRDVVKGGAINPGWLVATLCSRVATQRAGVFETLLFAHRVFTGTGERDLPNQLVATRARRLYPAVVMAIEQAGIRNSRIYARIAQHAELVGRVDDPARAIMASQQFQGALALTIGTIRAQTVTMEAGEKLLESLAAIPLDDGRSSRPARRGSVACGCRPSGRAPHRRRVGLEPSNRLPPARLPVARLAPTP